MSNVVVNFVIKTRHPCLEEKEEEQLRLIHGDSLDEMNKLIEEGVKVDAIICDPPYGSTQNKWDVVINFEEMWGCIKKIRNPKTPIILFGSEPFSSFLRLSNLKEYKYDWIWDKILKTGHLNAKKMPMGQHEVISVFGEGAINYYPIMEEGKPAHSKGNGWSKQISNNYGKETTTFKPSTSRMNYPTTLSFQKVHPSKCVHPTEKPIEIAEYLVKTYTKEGDLVLDFTIGSGVFGEACKKHNRDFIGIDNGICDKEGINKGKKWIDIAEERIRLASMPESQN